MVRLLAEYTCALLALSTPGDPLQGIEQSQKVPLAYVRTLLAPPSVLALRDRAPGDTATVKSRTTDSRTDRLLAQRAVARLDDAMREQLGRLAGIRFVSADAETEHSDAAHGRTSPMDHTEASRFAETKGADAVLLVTVDRFGLRTAFFREAWIRVEASVVMARSGEVRGPLYVVGSARTAPRLVRAGFMRSDEALIEEAAVEACSALVRGLEQGDAAPFAADVRVAVIPAAVPMFTAVAEADDDSAKWMAVPALARLSDVLFQPDIGPVAERVEANEVLAAMIGLGLASKDLWTASGPDVGAAASVARAVGAEYVFVSRVRAASVAKYEAEDGSESVGDIAEVLADFALIRAEDERTLWRSSHSGSARSHIFTPEGHRRIRTRVQCVMDAAVGAFAHGRFALDDWMRRRRNQRYPIRRTNVSVSTAARRELRMPDEIDR